MSVALILHTLAALIWVGGMFFAHIALRPAALALEPAVRLPLWRGVFARFFPWVWGSVAVLLLSGFAMIFLAFGGFRGVPHTVDAMMGIGLVMMAIYAHLFFAPWRRFRRAVEAADWPLAGRNIGQIRKMVTINLVLGLVTVAVAVAGRY